MSLSKRDTEVWKAFFFAYKKKYSDFELMIL